MVLGHSWLQQYNPSIDWSTSQILKFCSILHRGLTPSTSSGNALSLPEPTPQLPDLPLDSDSPPSSAKPFSTPSPVSIISAAAFRVAAKLPESQTFTVTLKDLETKAKSILVEKVDLLDIPEDYHDFADIFSKGKADTLAPH